MTQPQARRAKIAGEIRAELARQNLTYTALSAATGIDPSTLSRRLKGDKPFYLEELEKIAQFLGLPLSEFIERTEAVA
jgi:transcriptional regulator with XRE-family HTH domain